MSKPWPLICHFLNWRMVDYSDRPGLGPIGSTHFVTWEMINPAPGVFDWGPIDSLLEREAAIKVTLPDGRVIPRPVAMQVDLFLADHPKRRNHYWYDCTPTWVYERMGGCPSVDGRLCGHVLVANTGQKAVVPAYDLHAWREHWAAMVAALGGRYRDHPQITAWFISTGLDNEAHLAKDAGGYRWGDLINQQVPGLSHRFKQFVRLSMLAYRAAFPQAPIYILNTPAGMRRECTDYAAQISPPVGIKNCGMTMDLGNWEGIGGNVGMLDPWRDNAGRLPVWLETRFGLGTPAEMYWTWIAILAYHPDAVDVHPEYITRSDPAWLRFVTSHLGVTLADTPDVWVVLRDAEYPVHMWGSAGESGKRGNWEFWLRQVDNLPGSRTVRLTANQLPEAARGEVFSRQCRRTDQASGNRCMSFVVDPGWQYLRPKRAAAAMYEVSVTLLNQGNDTIALEYAKASTGTAQRILRRKGSALGPVGKWAVVKFLLSDADLACGLPGGASFRLSCEGDGDEFVHMVKVAGSWGPPVVVPPPAPPPQPPAPGPAPKLLVLQQGTDGYAGQADTSLDGWNPLRCYAGDASLRVRQGGIRVALMRWELPTLDAGAVIQRARLRLWPKSRTNANPMTVQVFAVNRPWDPASATWVMATAAEAWVAPGAHSVPADISSQPSGSVVVNALEMWVEIDILGIVRGWLLGVATNHGLLLSGTGAVSVEYGFCGAAWWDKGKRPQLLLEWI